MGSVYLFHEDFLYNSANCSCRPDGADVWIDHPTVDGTILYSIITPIICCFGICGNSISLIVLMKKELTGSVYTYLAVLAAMDLLMSITLFLGGLSRGLLFYKGWATYDALIGLPISGAISTLSIMATVGVTIDRVLYLWNPVCCTKPKFCDPKIARRIMTFGFFLSILLNLPYCFIFYWNESTLATTTFFDSKFYEFFNWFMLVCFSVLPAIILIFGNGFLIASLRRAKEITSKVGKRKKDHTHLTLTLISIIILFLISEIPSSLVNRTRAVSILFSGDHDRAKSTALEVIRQLCTILGAVNVTVNFFFYYLFCPAFCNALVKGLKNRTVKMKKSMHVNVFVVNSKTKVTRVFDTEAAREYFAKDENLTINSDSVEIRVCGETIKPDDKGDEKTHDTCFIDSTKNVYDYIYN